MRKLEATSATYVAGEASPLRILMIASEAPPVRSGIARTIYHLRRGLQTRAHQVDVLAYPSVPRLSLGEVRLSALLFQLLRRAEELDQYDVIHVHGQTPTVSDLALAFARLRRRRPRVVYTHHCDVDPGRAPMRGLATLYNAAHRRLSAFADHVVRTTHDYAPELSPIGKTSVIPLGVDLDTFTSAELARGAFTVLFVGQFRSYKGVAVLLDAMSSVQGGRLIIAGSGPEEQVYRSEAGRRGLDVEFHIAPSDRLLCALYQRADVTVLPSVTSAEAFGLVLLEGMAAGCVPVASDLPGVREVLGAVGLTFPVGDAVVLAAALRRLRDDPTIVRHMSAQARERAAAFSWDETVVRYEELYLRLAGVARSSAVSQMLPARGAAVHAA